MGVAVLHPRDCLRTPPFPHHYPLRTPKTTSNSNLNSNPNTNPNFSSLRGRRRNPRDSSRNSPPPSKQAPVMGQVKILKRGEDLPKMRPSMGSVQNPGNKAGLKIDQTHQNETVTKLSGSAGDMAGFYAGSGFFVSPPPSSVPLPAFFTKKVEVSKYDEATTDLRRILGIA